MPYIILSIVLIGLSSYAIVKGNIELAQYNLLLLISIVVTMHIANYWRNRK